MNIIEAIREQLFSLADEKYRTFSASLLPNVDNIIGVRLPLLRNIAKEISKTNYEEYLYSDEHIYFEEIMICGMAIGYAKEPPQQKLGHVEKFIPRINNWSVCDSFCNTLKFTNNNKEKMFEFLQPYFHSDKEFYVRFAVVMLLNYYVSEDYLLDAMEILDNIHNGDYYAEMAIAWAISLFYKKFPSAVSDYLTTSNVSDFVFKKALQKIIELKNVPENNKKQLKQLKRG